MYVLAIAALALVLMLIPCYARGNYRCNFMNIFKDQNGFTALVAILLVVIITFMVGAGVYTYTIRQDAAQKSAKIKKPDSAKPTPTTPHVATKGVIKGELSYPASVLPPQTVCAEHVSDVKDVTCVDVTT
ncbi:MAG TPA: hypothetical protein VMR98_05695, partial [Candidatus Polarisedimenticolaceae bacterium]|nr:hypothetical protein [Candidatus Polarisedimenticolaceae bacterium]